MAKKNQSIADAVKAGPVDQTLTPVDLMIRQLGVSKITAQSFMKNCSAAGRAKIEKCCKENDKEGAALAIYEEREQLIEKDKAVIDPEASQE